MNDGIRNLISLDEEEEKEQAEFEQMYHNFAQSSFVPSSHQPGVTIFVFCRVASVKYKHVY